LRSVGTANARKAVGEKPMARSEPNEKLSEDGSSRSNLNLAGDPEPDGGVRAICPFCGASNPTPEFFCCADWFAMMYPASDTEEVPAQRPTWLTLPKLETVQARLRAGSQLLVTLLASAIVAVLATLTTQWRVTVDSTPSAARPGSNLAVASLGNPFEAGGVPSLAAPSVGPASTAPIAAEPAAPLAPAPAVGAPPAAPAPMASEARPEAANPAPPPAVAVAEHAAAPSEQPPSVPVLWPQSIVMGKAEFPAAAGAGSRPSAPRRLAPAEQPARTGVKQAPPSTVDVESEVVPVAALPADRDVARVAAREASTIWREASAQVPRLLAPDDSSHWHSLRRGMNRDSVRRLLGEPKWKRRVVGAEFWLYEENSLFSDGWVSFADPGEELLGWRGSNSTR